MSSLKAEASAGKSFLKRGARGWSHVYAASSNASNAGPSRVARRRLRALTYAAGVLAFTALPAAK